MAKGGKTYAISTKEEQNGSKDHQNGVADKTSKPAEASEPPRRSLLQRYAFVITLTVSQMIESLGTSVLSQYRYSFFQEAHLDDLHRLNATKISACTEEGVADPRVQEVENTISAETAKWGLYGHFVSVIPMLVASLIIGMKSDQIGRRFLFLLPFISSFVHYGLLAAVIRLKLHYGYSLIGSFALACTGGRIGMSFAGFALVSDTHGKKPPTTQTTIKGASNGVQNKNKEKTTASEKGSEDTDLDMSTERSRMFKIVGLDALSRFSSGIFSLATGYIIKGTGYFYSVVIVLAVKVVLFIFSYCFITETGAQKKSTGFMAPLRLIGKAFKDPMKRTTLILCYLGIFLGMFGATDEAEVLQTYEMSPPFCLGSVQLGWLSSIRVMKGILAVPLLWFWKRIHLGESTISSVGLLSYTAGALLLSIVRQTWVFYVFPFIAIPGGLSLAVGKTIISRLIGRAALASSFALMMAGEEVFWFAGSMTSSYMYQKLVYTVPTAPFYAAAASFALAAMLFAVESLRQKCSPTAQEPFESEATDITIKKEPTSYSAI